MQVDLAKVIEALEVMFTHKNATVAQRREATNWLEQFQKTVSEMLIIRKLRGVSPIHC
jgi:hypothetical protein